MCKFSIIIPIYNVEKYLNKCVDSVLRQTFNDFEIILVDDGSPDNCGCMCDEYKNQDSRIKVIHKKNGGLSSARNAGIDVANGEYIIFVDSDDYWDDDVALKNINKNLIETNADLLVFPFKRFYEKSNKFTYALNITVERNRITETNVNEAIRYMLENNVYRASAWNKVIRKSIIDKYEMRFKEGYLSEDMDWCGNLLIYCNRFDYYENPLYVYRQQRSGSITVQKNEKLVSDKIFMCKQGYEQGISLKNKEKADLLLSYYAYEYSVALGVSFGIKNKKILSNMRNLQFLLTHNISNKVKQVNRLKNFVGYSLTRLALCFFVKIKR